jgi:co-chaperonin GroES (HSP10)
MTNKSGIRPCEYKCLVLPKAVELKTAGGLLLPESKIEKDSFARQEGVLVAVSAMAFTNPDWPDAPKVGDRVMFSKYNADEVQGRDGATYWIMKDTAIVAVLEQDE